jgi:hypothetical protein
LQNGQNRVLTVHFESLKDGLIDPPPGAGASLFVSPLKSVDQSDRRRYPGSVGFQIDFDVGEGRTSIRQLLGNTVLFFLQKLQRYCSGIMSLK